jgi:hypothetical protein
MNNGLSAMLPALLALPLALVRLVRVRALARLVRALALLVLLLALLPQARHFVYVWD